jgi:trigger factor
MSPESHAGHEHHDHAGHEGHRHLEITVAAHEESSVVRRLEVAVAAPDVRRAYDRAYRDLGRSARIRGFRPGKAPRSVLERLYGASVVEQVEQQLVAATLADALARAGLEPIAEPEVDATPPSEGQEFRYAARVEVKPAIELPDTTGLPARRPRVEVTDADVDAELEALRERNAPLVEEPEGTRAARGHVLTIDFAGTVDGKPFEGGSGKGVEAELGAGRFLADFEAQLEGALAGEDREVRVRFPDDYGSEALAGKEAAFAVHVVAVKRRALPALDDEFAKDLGDFESLAALRERIRSDLHAVRERASRAELRRSLVDALIDRTSFEVPPGLLSRELHRQLHAARHRLEGHVPAPALEEQLARWQDEWRPRAERDVREALLLEAAARAEGVEIGKEAVEARIDAMAKERGVSTARLRQAFDKDALEYSVRLELRDEQVLARLAERAKVEETTHS